MRAIRSFVVVAVLAATAGTSTAAAQGVTVSVGGGPAVPLGFLNSGTNIGVHAMAAVSVAPAAFPIGIRVDGMYHRYGFSGGADGHFRVFQGAASAVYHLPAAESTTIRPYLLGGVGLYNYKSISDFPFTPDESTTDVGINGGVGVDVIAGALRLFTEARYHNVFTPRENVEFLPITVGVRLGGR
jgi:hypothetical protein